MNKNDLTAKDVDQLKSTLKLAKTRFDEPKLKSAINTFGKPLSARLSEFIGKNVTVVYTEVKKYCANTTSLNTNIDANFKAEWEVLSQQFGHYEYKERLYDEYWDLMQSIITDLIVEIEAELVKVE